MLGFSMDGQGQLTHRHRGIFVDFREHARRARGTSQELNNIEAGALNSSMESARTRANAHRHRDIFGSSQEHALRARVAS